MHSSVPYPSLRCMLGYSKDQQLCQQYHLTTLGIQVHLLISWLEYGQLYCYEVYAYVTQWSTS